MKHEVRFDGKCFQDLLFWSRKSPAHLNRILEMIELLQSHPGKENDERVHIWAIDEQNDLIFQHPGKEIRIHSCKGLDPNE